MRVRHRNLIAAVTAAADAACVAVTLTLVPGGTPAVADKSLGLIKAVNDFNANAGGLGQVALHDFGP